jgi:hypothetical protein
MACRSAWPRHMASSNRWRSFKGTTTFGSTDTETVSGGARERENEFDGVDGVFAAAESTNERVAWYTVFETIAIVALAVGQIVLVRRWFETTRGLPGGLS